MREILEEIFINEPLDPRESARRGARPTLRKRFYEKATAGEGEGGFAVLLDGKPIRTPARRPLAAPNRALAEAIAAEWNAQVESIDPSRMPLTRLANAAIDGVADVGAAVAEEVANYLGSDLVCYRAGTPEGLVARQQQAWDPVLAWSASALGARFTVVEGIVHVAQPDDAVAAARTTIPDDPWRLAAVASITTLTGSALLALALAHGAIEPGVAWAAAHVDEDWQMSQWGRDDMAMARRDFRRSEFEAAATVLRLVD